jgi:3-oxoacyl-[acyl-carrier-protein] synthase-3
LGKVAKPYGLLSQSWRTDSQGCCALVDGVPGKEWYEEGRIVGYLRDKRLAREMVFTTADLSRQVVDEAMASAGIERAQVAFYASHQSSHWLRPVTQRFNGLGHAHSVDTFSWAASLSAANIPLQLAVASRDGMLKSGDIVVMFAQGSGTTSAGMVARWGSS